MATSREYLEYISEQLPEDTTHRAMMGEYVLYYHGRVIGGIYDDRFLVKPTESAKRLMPNAAWELPYEGAKQMLMVTETDNKEFLYELFEAMYPELTEPKAKNKTKK